MLPIPNFSRYRVLDDPFRIWDTKNKCEVAMIQRKRNGHDNVHLWDDSGRRRTLSVVTVACLAYRGLPPQGWRALHSGGHISKTTVRWVSRREYNSTLRSILSLNEQDRVVSLYFSGEYTQDELAAKFNCSQPVISRTISKMGKRHEST